MTQEQNQGAYLVILNGSLSGKRVELWKECTTIGRSRDRDIFLDDLTVHRKQASIFCLGDDYVLRDDHGNGDSFVNGNSSAEYKLQNGDQLLFGDTQMVFYSNEGTRPFQLPVSRGKESLLGKETKPPVAIAHFDVVVVNKSISPYRIELLPSMSIGRSRKCDIFLEDLAVSRVHAMVEELSDGRFVVTDNQSATGTFINGQQMHEHILQDHDVVQIGSYRFTFCLTSSP